MGEEGILAIKHHPQAHTLGISDTGCGQTCAWHFVLATDAPKAHLSAFFVVEAVGIVFFPNLSTPVRSAVFAAERRRPSWARRLSGEPVTEAARAFGDLLLLDSDDVDGNGVELEKSEVSILLFVLCSCAFRGFQLTPMDLSMSLVSWSTSNWPLSEFWVKSRAETSGTY